MRKASAFQTLVWNFQFLYPESSAYHLAYRLSFDKSDQSLIAIKSAILRAIQNYPLSRAKFSYQDELNIKLEDGSPLSSLIEYSEIFNEEIELEQEYRRLASKPFAMTEGPWIRLYFLSSKEKTNLLFVTHHLIWDGACFKLFITDLLQLLTSSGNSLSFETSPYGYLDYLSESLTTNNTTQSLMQVPEYELVLDFQRPRISKRQGDKVQFELSSDLTKSLLKQAKLLRTTPYQLILAYTLMWIGRCTRSPFPSLISPFGNRSTSRSAKLKGPLVATGKIGASVTSKTTWKTMLGELKASVSTAKKEALLSAKGIHPFPKSYYILTFQNHFTESLEIENYKDLVLTPIVPDASKSDLEWVIHAHPKDRYWRGWLEYDSELFLHESAQNIIGSWLQGLEALSQEINLDEQYVFNIGIVPPSHKRKLSQWFESTCTEISFESLTTRLQLAFKNHQKEAALIFLKDSMEVCLTYQDLDEKTNDLANKLIKANLSKNKFIGISFHRSPEMIIALLATIKAGLAYVPLDPDLPDQRLAEMVQDSCIQIVVSNFAQSRWQNISSLIQVLPYVHTDEGSKIAPVSSPQEDDPAYLIFTSGSTGKPKGAVNSHRALFNRLRWHQKEYGLKARERVLQKTPYTFDVSVWEFFWPLCEGGCVVLAPHDSHKDPQALVRIIQDQKINYLHFVPSMLEAFLDEVQSSSVSLSPLKKVLCSGEALLRSTANRFFDLLPQIELHNLYGPTECAIDVSSVRVLPGDCDPITIGKAIDNLQLYIFDEADQIVPIGIQGEIIIGGMGVGHGYEGKPNLTAQKFFEHPNYGKLYRTGDIGRYLDNGEIQYLGRVDFQVKWKGFRIELEEIETQITTHYPNLRCRVRLRGQDALVAYIKLSDKDSHNNLIEIRRQVSSTLRKFIPEYMIPTEWRYLNEFPVSNHGKSDAKRLDEVSALIEDTSMTYPRSTERFTPLEGLLIPIWEEVLNRFPVFPSSSFFELGGDSLKVLRIRSKLRTFRFDFEVKNFFDDPTLRGMASLIEKDTIPSTLPSIIYTPTQAEKLWLEDLAKYSTITQAYPARELEVALVYISETRSISHPGTYHDVFHLKVRTPHSTSHLIERWNKLNSIHPILRANLHLDAPEKPLWVVRDKSYMNSFVLPPDTNTTEWIFNLIYGDIHPFCLKDGPLIRLFLLEPEESGEREIILSFHHSALDGWSASVLINDLLSNKNLDHVLRPSLGTGWMKEQDALKNTQTISFWKKAMEGVFPTILEPISKNQNILEASWSNEDYKKLLKISGDSSVSLKNLLLAVHLRALQFLTHSSHVSSGMIMNGRDLEEGEENLGLYLLNIPITTSHTGNLLSLARELSVFETSLAEHRHYPLSKIIQCTGHEQIFNSAFNYTQFSKYDDLIADGPTPFFRAYESTEFSILCNWHVQPSLSSPLLIRVVYQWENQSVSGEIVLSLYKSLLNQLLAKADPYDLSWLSNRPTLRSGSILFRWRDYSVSTPDHPAIIFSDGAHEESITYATLAGEVDKWKNRFIGLDAKRASIDISKSPEALAIMLALVESKICVIPIDTTLPKSRQHTMLAQSSPDIRFLQDGEEIKIVQHIKENCNNSSQTRSALYILFTSGSTGQPKAIEMGEEAFARLINWQTDSSKNGMVTSQYPGKLRTLQYASWSFDVSFQEIFSTLVTGGTLLLPSDNFRKDLSEVNRWSHYHGVERIFLPFILLNHFCSSALEEGIFHEHLRTVISAGEQLELTPEIIKFFEKHHKAKLFNQYGPTESHVVTESFVDAQDPDGEALPSIGIPIWGTSLSIRSTFLEGNPVTPSGVPGELWISGSCLANGYLEPSAKWITTEGVRWYRSGDLVQIHPKSQSIMYLGRIDNQIKINGQRIELSEIEVQLMEAAVKEKLPANHFVAWHIPELKMLLSALISNKEIDPLAEKKLKESLSDQLTQSMIPSRIFILNQKDVPLTSSGKVDRKKLAEISKDWIKEKAKDSIIVSKELSKIEMSILKIWEEILNKPLNGEIASGFEADFGKLGGNSLSYLRLLAKLSKDAGRKLRLEDLLHRPTLLQQAKWLQGEGLDSRRKLPETCIELFRPIRMPKATLVLIHPIGGSVQCYQPLLDVFRSTFREKDIRIIAIQSPSKPINSMSELACKYLDDLKKARILIEGHPISFIGWSFGGVVAVEMTSQMEKKGLAIHSLTLLDSIALKEKIHEPVCLITQVEWFFWELLGMYQTFPQELEEEVQIFLKTQSEPNNVHDAFAILEECLNLAEARRFITGIDPSAVRHYFCAFSSNLKALQNYIPSRISTKLHLFRCQEKLPTRLKSVHEYIGTQFDEPTHGWQKFCHSPVEIHYVEGDHVTLIQKPYVDNLGTLWMKLMGLVF
jgi:amino acid adenylation domain-containing protein